MRKLLFCLIFLGFIFIPAFAQKAEIFAGYQFGHLESSYNASGWNAALQGNFKHVLGIKADFSGVYKNNTDFYTYTVGPVLTARFPVVQPFVHALFGGGTATSSGHSHSGFAMYVGGGMDIGLRKGIGIRLFQADWLSTRFSGVTRNKNGRVSTGIVLKF